jgi:hypothetical protein
MSTSLYVFLEEYSAKLILEGLLPKILPDGVCFQIFSHQGKLDYVPKTLAFLKIMYTFSPYKTNK